MPNISHTLVFIARSPVRRTILVPPPDISRPPAYRVRIGFASSGRFD
jgi:hypothetical protein